jgi:hypothetical protein
MTRRTFLALLASALAVGLLAGLPGTGRAQPNAQQYQQLNRFYYYPYHYFPHNYWPSQGPKWPEPPGGKLMPPPAYMTYPPYLEKCWRFELWEPQKYYRGFHFWLDQF